jgi:hypothetical protein
MSVDIANMSPPFFPLLQATLATIGKPKSPTAQSVTARDLDHFPIVLE